MLRNQRGVTIFSSTQVVITIVTWAVVLIMTGGISATEGGLVAAVSLFGLAIYTVVSAVDLLAVYFIKRGKKTILPTLSLFIWGVVSIIYMCSFGSEQAWQSKVVLGIVILFALFKIFITFKLTRFTESLLNS